MSVMKALAPLLAATALAAGVSLAEAQGKPQVLRLLDVGESFAFVDSDRSGGEQPTAGDVFLFRDGLYRWTGRKRGPRVGRIEGLCTFTSSFGCEAAATFYLPAGKLQVAGHVFFAAGGEPERIALAVVGGTGRYAGARGTASGRPIPVGDRTAFVVRLIR